MAGSSFGSHFQITTWGESHGKALGVVIDGCPAGLSLCEDDIQTFLNRRKPGQSKYSTPRREADQIEILSGIFEGKTTGTPISMLVYNTNQRSSDYGKIASVYRPGHADLTYDLKYGFRDYRGGGRSSGRETIGRVAAGAVAVKLLSALGISFSTYTLSIGDIQIDPAQFSEQEIQNNALYMPDADAAEKAAALITACMQEKNSVGGIVECKIFNCPAGLGEPCFDKLDASFAKALMSIGAVKAVEIGDGTLASKATGRTNNDQMHAEDGQLIKNSNHAGGIYGGISDGSTITLRAHIKPTPSISASQTTVTTDGNTTDITIGGRHDPVIVPRAVVVVESMAALTVADALLTNMGSQVAHLKQIYCPKNHFGN